MIYNQTKIPKDRWRYGLRSSAATGCGWIAAYNALELLGCHAEPEQLIRYFQRQLPLIHGNAGTLVTAPEILFRRLGFPVKTVLRRSYFDQAAKNAPACILYYRWRRGIRMGAHFVALRHTPGGFEGYNTYRSSAGPDAYGESLEAFLKEKGYFGAVLLCIEKKQEPEK